jgi:hypothetical protein
MRHGASPNARATQFQKSLRLGDEDRRTGESYTPEEKPRGCGVRSDLIAVPFASPA